MRILTPVAAVAFALSAVVVSPAWAGLIGDTVTISSSNAFHASPNSVIVAAGTSDEFAILSGSGTHFFDGNIEDNSFQLSYAFSFAGFITLPGLTLSGLDFGSGNVLTGVSVGTSGGTILGGQVVNFTSSSLTLDVSGVEFFPGSAVTFTFTSGPASAPEPTSLAILAAGLLGLAAASRRPDTA